MPVSSSARDQSWLAGSSSSSLPTSAERRDKNDREISELGSAGARREPDAHDGEESRQFEQSEPKPGIGDQQTADREAADDKHAGPDRNLRFAPLTNDAKSRPAAATAMAAINTGGIGIGLRLMRHPWDCWASPSERRQRSAAANTTTSTSAFRSIHRDDHAQCARDSLQSAPRPPGKPGPRWTSGRTISSSAGRCWRSRRQ